MGWLDNSTNNIILDAVLTDYGREALARNNGSFNIVKFSLGDDEVNYGIIKKYGRTIGREKIEKNTPVFEALTNQNLALKHKLISIPSPLVYLPLLQLTVGGSSGTVTLQGTTTSEAITIEQKLASSDSSTELDPSIADSNFDIYYPSLFLALNSLSNAASQVSQDTLRTAHAKAAVSSQTATTSKRTATFTIFKKTISDDAYNTYGRQVTTNNTTTSRISTSIKVVGQNSGLSLTIPIEIVK